ncbi:MAG: hypothetical protein IIB60_02065 [Planctomycetes bacterium]|nr:hypothetical protein [Planctomycetota bacterium]
MSTESLETLISPDFEAGIVASAPNVLRLLLLRTAEVERLRRDYDAGHVTDDDIRSFVTCLLQQNATALVFPYETAIAAIAVMLEPRFSEFTDEFLIDLARVRTRRFAMASRVARICLSCRSHLPKANKRSFRVSTSCAEPVSFVDVSPLLNATHAEDITRAEFALANA